MKALRLLTAMVALGTGLAGSARQADASTAAELLQGGAFCFDMSVPGTDSFEHLMLSVEPAGAAMAGVHAIQKGNLGGDDYVNQFAGTATVAPSNDSGSDAPTLYVGLIGNGMGLGEDGSAELYTFSFSLALDPATLIGKVYGSEFQSDTLGEGKPFATKAAVGRVADVKPMSCADY